MLKVKVSVLLFMFFSLFYMGCGNKNTNKKDVAKIVTDSIIVHDFTSLEPLLYTDSEQIHVVNFWAMWCAPCVKELPIFEAYAKKNTNAEVLLVSMDFPKDIETELKPFLKKKEIKSKVVLLDDPDANSWIDEIDSNWSGALPFTIIYTNNSRSFHERPFESLADLENEIKKTINK